LIRSIQSDIIFAEMEAISGIFKRRRMVGSNGEFTGLLGIISDITDRKRAEDELQESEHRLEISLISCPIATFAVDKEAKVIAWNGLWKR